MRSTFLCILIICVLAGCSDGGRDRDDGKIVIEYWHQPMVSVIPGKEDITREPGDFERYLARQFMREHPNVIVRTQCLNWEDLPRKVPISVMGGSPPDVLQDYLGRTSGYWYQGVLEPLEDVVAAEREDFQPEMLDENTLDGHLHAVPLFGWAQVLALNRAAWQKIGKTDLLPTPDNPHWNFEQFERAIKAVAVPNKVFPIGLQVASEQGDYSVLQFFWGHGAKVYENRQYDQVALNSPEGVKALTWLVEAHKQGLIQPNVATVGGSELSDMFWRGAIVCRPNGPGLIRSYEIAKRDGRVPDGVDIDLMFTLPPTEPGVKVSLPFATSGLVVFKQADAQKKAVVKQFVRFMCRPEVIRDYCIAANQLPSRKSVADVFEDNPALSQLQKHVASCGRADMGLTSPHYYDIRKRLPPHLQFAFLGMKTPKQALADFFREAETVLEK